jgi:hypothetical protein
MRLQEGRHACFAAKARLAGNNSVMTQDFDIVIKSTIYGAFNGYNLDRRAI